MMHVVNWILASVLLPSLAGAAQTQESDLLLRVQAGETLECPESLRVWTTEHSYDAKRCSPFPVEADTLALIDKESFGAAELQLIAKQIQALQRFTEKDGGILLLAILSRTGIDFLDIEEGIAALLAASKATDTEGQAGFPFSGPAMLSHIDRLTHEMGVFASNRRAGRIVLYSEIGDLVLPEALRSGLDAAWASRLAGKGMILYRLRFSELDDALSGPIRRLAGREISAIAPWSQTEAALQEIEQQAWILTTNIQPSSSALPVSLALSDDSPQFVHPELLWMIPPGYQAPSLDDLWAAEQITRRLGELKRVGGGGPVGIQLAESLLRLNPFEAQHWIDLAQRLEALEAVPLDRLLTLLAEARVLFDDNVEIRLRQANAFDAAGMTEKAVDAYTDLLRLDSDCLEGRQRLAGLLLSLNRTEQALRHMERLLDTELDNASLRVDLAKALRALHRPLEGYEQAIKAVEMEPLNPTANSLLMHWEREQGKFQGSLQRAEIILRAAPHDEETLRVRALLHSQIGRYAEAIPLLREQADAHPADSEVLMALGHSLNARSRWLESLEIWSSLVEIEPSNEDAYLGWAEAHHHLGDAPAEQNVLKEGFSQVPGSVPISLRLGRIFERLELPSEALRCYSAALQSSSVEDQPAIRESMALLHLWEGELLTAFDLLEQNGQQQPLLQSTSLKVPNPEPQLWLLPGGTGPIQHEVPFLGRPQSGPSFLADLFLFFGETEEVLRKRLITFYREFPAFVNWLKKRKLYQPVIELPISEDKQALRRTNKVLGYFDVKVNKKRRGKEVFFEAKSQSAKEKIEKSVVLQFLGVKLGILSQGQTITLDLRDEQAPLLMGTDFWFRILGKSSAESHRFLEFMLDDEEARQLYVGLHKLPPPARHWLQERLGPAGLAQAHAGLFRYGSLLLFDRDGSLKLPGGDSAETHWSRLVGASYREQANDFLKVVFTKDKGKCIYFLAMLSRASPEAAHYIVEDYNRFNRIYQSLMSPGPNFLSHAIGRGYFDAGDLFWSLRVRDGRLLFPASSMLWPDASDNVGKSRAGWFSADDRLLLRVLSKRRGPTLPDVQRFVLLSSIASERPDLAVAAPAAKLLLQERFAPLFPLFQDLTLPAQSIEAFLSRAEELEEHLSDRQSWVSFSLFQAPFVLLQYLANSGRLERDEAAQLSRELLVMPISAVKQGPWAQKLAHFLRERLADTATSQSEGADPASIDGLLSALGLPQDRLQLRWGNKSFGLHLKQQERERFERVLSGQRILPLESVVAAFYELDRLREGEIEALHELKALLLSWKEPLQDTIVSEDYRKEITHFRLDRARAALRRLEKGVAARRQPAVKSRARRLEEELAPLLAESLAGWVYAANVQDSDLMMEIDPHFVRKHSFVTVLNTSDALGPAIAGAWGRPLLRIDAIVQSRIAGGLPSLSVGIASARAEQWPMGTKGRFAHRFFPLLQSLSVDLLQPAHVDAQTIRFVEHAYEMVRKALAASCVDHGLLQTVEEFFNRHLGPARAFEALKHLEEARPQQARELLTPFEVVNLGRFLATREDPQLSHEWRFWAERESTGLQQVPYGLRELGHPVSGWTGFETLKWDDPIPIEALTSYISPFRLAARSCDLKIKLAWRFSQLSAPPILFKPIAQQLLTKLFREVSQRSMQDWQSLMGALRKIDSDMTGKEIQQLLETFE